MDSEVPYNNRVSEQLGCNHQRAAIPGDTAAMCGVGPNGKVCCGEALATSFWCTSNSQDKGASTKKRNWIMFTILMNNVEDQASNRGRGRDYNIRKWKMINLCLVEESFTKTWRLNITLR